MPGRAWASYVDAAPSYVPLPDTAGALGTATVRVAWSPLQRGDDEIEYWRGGQRAAR